MDIIIYGSQHGSAKRYAEGLAERTGLKAVDYKEADSLGLYNRIIYFGAIYAGGVTGLKKTVAKLTHGQELYVITVGMVDPEDQTFIGSLREALKKQIPPQMYDENKIFHLRGAIDYSQLELKYRILMKMMYSQAAKLPEEKLTSPRMRRSVWAGTPSSPPATRSAKAPRMDTPSSISSCRQLGCRLTS